MNRYIIILILMLSTLLSYSQETTGVPSHPDEDFVEVDVLIIGTGEDFTSCMGHSALRMQCPTHDLDYVFDVVQEDLGTNAFSFARGKLMSFTNITPSVEYIDRYISEGRSIIAYRLDLPIATKQRLWEILDNHASEDPRPLTRLHESCSGRLYEWLREATEDSLAVACWPKLFERSIYEMGYTYYGRNWRRFFFGTFAQGNTIDANLPNTEKIVIPMAMEEVLKVTEAHGRPIIRQKEILNAQKSDNDDDIITPSLVAFLLFILSLANFRINSNALSMTILAFPLLIGLMTTITVLAARIECLSFNWLTIPFSPLPWLFYKYRRYWLLGMSVICLIWSAAMLSTSHQIVLNSHIILALATAFAYAQLAYSNKREKTTLNE